MSDTSRSKRQAGFKIWAEPPPDILAAQLSDFIEWQHTGGKSELVRITVARDPDTGGLVRHRQLIGQVRGGSAGDWTATTRTKSRTGIRERGAAIRLVSTWTSRYRRRLLRGLRAMG